MPGYFTDYVNNKVLDLLFGAQALAAPATLYVGLSTGLANKAGTVIEPTTGSYARVAVTSNLTNFPAAVAGGKANATAVTFPTATAGWGTVQSWFVADAATGGNVLLIVDLPAPRTIVTTNTPSFAIGAMSLQFS